MKAAVIWAFGDSPRYEDFPDPVLEDGDTLIQVRAVVLENFDKMTVGGKHYASQHLFPAFPAIVGHSGIGTLADGRLVAFGGVRSPYGTMAEKVVIPQQYSMHLTPIPMGVTAGIAAALPAAALTSLLPLQYGVKIRSGESVLINGATGVSGKIAIQIAKLLGAGRIVASGRDEEGLQAVTQLGADATIDLKQSDEQITAAFLQQAGQGYDVVLDFLWGHPTELLLKTFVPKEAGFASHRTRFVQIGEAAGAQISLPANTLRTSGVEMTGAGSFSPEVVPEAVKQVWAWMRDQCLSIDIEEVPLARIEEAWQRETRGKRLVIVP